MRGGALRELGEVALLRIGIRPERLGERERAGSDPEVRKRTVPSLWFSSSLFLTFLQRFRRTFFSLLNHLLGALACIIHQIPTSRKAKYTPKAILYYYPANVTL